MTVLCISSELLTLKLSLMVERYKPKRPLKILVCCLQGQGHRELSRYQLMTAWFSSSVFAVLLPYRCVCYYLLARAICHYLLWQGGGKPVGLGFWVLYCLHWVLSGLSVLTLHSLFSLQPAADSVWGSDVDSVCMVTSFCVTFSKRIAILLCVIDCRRTEDNLHVCVSVHPQP